MRKRISAGTFMLVTVLVIGGASVAWSGKARQPSAAPAIEWPKPPQQPLIRLVAVVESPGDLGIRGSFWKRLARAVRGDENGFLVRPADVASDGGIVYIADPGASSLWILDPRGRRSRRVRSAGPQALVSPVAVTPGRDGQVYVVDSVLARVFLFGADGKLAATIEDPEMSRPADAAYDQAADRLYVADSAGHRIWIFGPGGKRLGAMGGHGADAGEFNYPTHLMVEQDGTLLVTDALGFRIQMFSREGTHLGSFGRQGDGSGDFASPKGIGVDSEGHVYVVDALFDAVQIFDREGSFLMSFGGQGEEPGEFWLPGGLFIDEDDRVYVADSYNRRIQIFEYLGGGVDG